MDKALLELIKISNAVGRDAALVQGGGGNTSVKTADGKYMYIKASGTALKNMNARQGWRRMRLDSVRSIIKDKSMAKLDVQKRETEVVNRLLLACDDKPAPAKAGGIDDARPSLEAHLHAFLDKCVIHLHPDVVGAYVNAKDGKAELERLFKDEKLPLLWIPYPGLGYMLAKKLAKQVEDYQSRFADMPSLIFLQKHGLLVSAKTADAALRLVRQVISRCSNKLKQPKVGKVKSLNRQFITETKLCIRKAFFEATGEYTMVSHFYDKPVAEFLAEKDAQKMLSSGVLTPDELLYANGPAMWIEGCVPEKIARKLTLQIEKGEKPSIAFLVTCPERGRRKGVGLFIAAGENFAPIVRDVVSSSFFIRANAHRLGGIVGLNKSERAFINQWETDAFRRKLATGRADGELTNRIAVVTGAGSGLGKSIAVGLAKAGAAVALVDIDKKAAEETAQIIRKSEIGNRKFQTMIVQCDVTDESDVKKAFGTVLDNWGGLDILVNAAGIAPAYPLIDIPVDKWRLALEVNLTGYLLMAKEAARIMIAQGMCGSIINLSSKSGLDASKNNTAYNATKAGEIHIARGWALELGGYGIRVNCVAPGNVFEGSKIWNPRYIKICAKKYGIRPEEVIAYYVGRTALKREIKGQDVADSVVFLCSDKARTITGQILIPDSGQVMVR
jgi:NAD(P)-dependent dehydrogenase (short-subunit alcohol dehydrogenase family)/rhamnose utilization protein RhaD (predicted bifunctional aldolase and dehydrogenase)